MALHVVYKLILGTTLPALGQKKLYFVEALATHAFNVNFHLNSAFNNFFLDFQSSL